MACGSADFLVLLAALDTGELLAAACAVSVGLGACGLSLVAAAASVAKVAGAGVLLGSVFSAPVATGSACSAVTGAVHACSCVAMPVALFAAAGFLSGADLTDVACFFVRLGCEDFWTVLVLVSSTVLVASVDRGFLSLSELLGAPSLLVVRFFFAACLSDLLVGVAVVCAAVSVLPFLGASVLARDVPEDSDVLLVFFSDAWSADLSASSRERLAVEFVAEARGCAGAVGLVGGTCACCVAGACFAARCAAAACFAVACAAAAACPALLHAAPPLP